MEKNVIAWPGILKIDRILNVIIILVTVTIIII